MAYINLPVTGGSTPTVVSSFWAQYPTNPSNYIITEFDVWPNVISTGVGNLLASSSGASAAFQLVDKSDASAGINSTEKAIGVALLNTGTTTTGRAYVGFGTNSVASVWFGAHELRWGVRSSLNALSDGTDTYTVYHGFIDTVTAAPTRGAFFRYTHGTNGGRWEFCRADGAGIVAADTGVAPSATVYQVLEIVVNTAGTQITFYIDGALVGTITTGITSSGVFPGSNVIKSAGTTGRGAYLDATYLAVERLAVR